MLCLIIAGPLLDRQDRINPQLPWGQLLMGPEHAHSSQPCTSGLAPIRLVQPEFDEFYLMNSGKGFGGISLLEAASYSMASGVSIADWWSRTPFDAASASGTSTLRPYRLQRSDEARLQFTTTSRRPNWRQSHSLVKGVLGRAALQRLPISEEH